MKQFLRRAWPWLVGVAIVVVLAARVPFEAFGNAIHEGPHLRLAELELGVLVVILASDTLATWVSLIAVGIRWPLRDVFAVRGATYVLSVLNYAVGQGGLAYYLHKAGVSTLRATGMTLFMMGTTLACMLLTTAVTWMLGVDGRPYPTLDLVLLVGCGLFAIYLVVIALAPRALARRELLAPLFEARVRGHILTLLGRLPHVAIILLGHWLAMRVWGYQVPFAVALVTMPVVVIVTAIPISPGGLGTTQAALVYFFSAYAPGITDEQRAGHVLAFAIVHFVYATVWQLVIGLACVPLARRVQPARSV